MVKIFINPGHGQKANGIYDPGAVGPTNYQEATYTKAIGALLYNKLEKIANLYLYQSGDLTPICTTANNWGADWFVSIHGNASSSASAYGIETYCFNSSGHGLGLAKSVQLQLVNKLGRADRGVKEANFQVLRDTTMPAILAEIGFISNAEEEALMKTSKWQDDAAEALAIGLSNYIGLGYSPAAGGEGADQLSSQGENTGSVDPLPQGGETGGTEIMENLVVWESIPDQWAAQYLMDKLSCSGMSLAEWQEQKTPAKTVYKVGGPSLQGTVLLTGYTLYDTARVVLDWIAKH